MAKEGKCEMWPKGVFENGSNETKRPMRNSMKFDYLTDGCEVELSLNNHFGFSAFNFILNRRTTVTAIVVAKAPPCQHSCSGAHDKTPARVTI